MEVFFHEVRSSTPTAHEEFLSFGVILHVPRCALINSNLFLMQVPVSKLRNLKR